MTSVFLLAMLVAGDRAVLARHCFACHGPGATKGDLALDRLPVTDARRWQEVLERVKAGEMPPEGEPQPTAAERRRLARWIEREVLRPGCRARGSGPPVVRRLNRREYENTLRDLLGVAVPIAGELPVDDAGLGFDTVGASLSLSPALMEKLLAAADRALDAALFVPALHRTRRRSYPMDALEVGYSAKRTNDGWVILNSHEEDDVAATVDVPFEARYAIRFRGFATVDEHRPYFSKGAAAPYGQQEPHPPVRVTVMVDRQIAAELEVPAGPARSHEAELRVPPGRHRFRVVVRRIKDGLSAEKAARWRVGPDQWGVLSVDHLEVEGPLDGERRLPPESHRRIFFVEPAPGGERDAAAEILTAFARRAYRRPARADELAELLALAERAWGEGDGFEQGVRVALQAALVSPQLLMRSEHLDGGGQALASRLSYFLWSSLPDEALLAEAERGTLRRNLAGAVRRMLRDPKAQAFVESFAGQWLELRNLERVTIDEKTFKVWKDGFLRESMRGESEQLFGHILREDRSVLEFLEADYTFVDEALAEHYGLPRVPGPGFHRVSLQGTPRRGLLGHASILTLTSNPTRTSPVKRGKWVLEALLNAPPPPPPPDAPAFPEGKELTGTLRRRMEQHRQNPVCASCHARMDPIGFGLEGFDAIGVHRTVDNGAPVDAAGRLASGERFGNAVELARILATRRRDDFARALVEKVLTYALGRGLDPADRCAVEQIRARTARAGHRFSALIQGVAAHLAEE